MAQIEFANNTGKLSGDVNGTVWSRLLTRAGNAIFKQQREKLIDTDEFLPIAIKNDDISVGLRGDRKGNLITGNYTAELIETFELAALNLNRWNPITLLNYSSVQGTATGLQLNNTNATTANAYGILVSAAFFKKIPRVPLQIKARVNIKSGANTFADIGFGIPSTNTLLVSNGCAVRCIAGVFKLVLTNNTVFELVSDMLKPDGTNFTLATSLDANFYVIDIIADDDNVVATIQNTETGDILASASIKVPLSLTKMWGATALPFYARLASGVSTSTTAPTLIITELQVLSTDMLKTLSAKELSGQLQLSGSVNPFSGITNTATNNSVAVGVTTLSNTTATYVNTVKDGRFTFAAPSGSTQDYIIFGYLVPAGARMAVSGMLVTKPMVTGAASATTPTVLEWGLSLNGTALSLATTNTKRRVVGSQVIPVGAVVGSLNDSVIDVNFPEEVIEGNRWCVVMLRIPVGTATASQLISGNIMLKSRFL